jgi:hypothetical protein
MGSFSSDQQPKRRRIGHQYATNKPVKHPEEKTFEINFCRRLMDREEFADESGNIPDVLPVVFAFIKHTLTSNDLKKSKNK